MHYGVISGLTEISRCPPDSGIQMVRACHPYKKKKDQPFGWSFSFWE